MLTIKDLSFDKELDRSAFSVVRGGRIKLDLDAKEKHRDPYGGAHDLPTSSGYPEVAATYWAF
jgi:hypothetical protein